MTFPHMLTVAALFALAVAYLDLRIRHARCKRTLDRVAIERDEARATLWEASRADAAEPESDEGEEIRQLLLTLDTSSTLEARAA